MGDLIVAAAVEIADAGAGARAGAGGAAVGGKTADPGFQMDGHQIGHDERAVQQILRYIALFRVNDDRNGGGHTLVSAAGIDDDRQFAAVHTRVGTGCRPGLRPILNAVAVGLQQDLTDACAISFPQTGFGDLHVAVDLPLEDIPHVVEPDLVGEGDDLLHRQQRAVSGRLHHLVGKGLVQQDLAVFFDPHHIGVVTDHADVGGVVSGGKTNLNVKGAVGGGLSEHKFGGAEKIVHPAQRFRSHVGEHFKLPVRIAAADARGHRGTKTLSPRRMRHDDALDVLDDVAADGQLHAFGQGAQSLFCQSACISNGDRLGAARCRDQLFTKNIHIGLVDFLIHYGSPLGDIRCAAEKTAFYRNADKKQ